MGKTVGRDLKKNWQMGKILNQELQQPLILDEKKTHKIVFDLYSNLPNPYFCQTCMTFK